MSTTPPDAFVTASIPYRSPWDRWKDFWFRAADPTTLGFLRITTGLLVLYIHLAYSVDLQAFFGKHGWYSAQFIDRERHESPSYSQPFWSWDETLALPRLSDFPHRRAAMMQFLRGLPADPAGRASALRYLTRANQIPNQVGFTEAMLYVQRIKPQPEELSRTLTALTGGKVEVEVVAVNGERKLDDRTKQYAPPAVFANLPADEKSKLADEIRSFWTALGTIPWADTEKDRNYVFHHFVESGYDSRKAFIDYVNSLPAEADERAQLLDYLEYWNSDPRKALRTGSGIFSVWFHVTDPTQMALVHAGVLVIIVLFTVGAFTRVTSVLTWIACVGYIHRTQHVLFGMDTMMNILLFYLMIGNSGAALSVDRLINRYRAARSSLRRSGTIDANTLAFLACPPPSVGAGFAMRLIQIHFCFIYMAAGLSKLKGTSWWGGQAFWEVVVNPEFTLMQYQWYESGLRAFTMVKPLFYTLTIGAVWGTLFIEIAMPFLVWTRLRWLMMLLATVMHAIIGVLMGLNLFELLMMVMILAFLPDRVIRDRFRGGPTLPKLTYGFSAANATQSRAAALALAADADNQIALVPNPGATTPTVTGPDGKRAAGPDGVAALFQSVRLLSVLSFVLWVPGVRVLLAKFLFPAAGATTNPVVTPAAQTAAR